MNHKILSTVALIIFSVMCFSDAYAENEKKPHSRRHAEKVRMLLGSYGSADKERIQLYNFDQITGEAQKIDGLTGVAEASYLAVAPDRRHVYAVSETDDDKAALVAIEIKREHHSRRTTQEGPRHKGHNLKLSFINSNLTDGTAPCYVNVEKNRKFAYTANYNGSSFTVFGIDPTTGKLLDDKKVFHFEGSGPVTDRQEKSHIHCVEFSPDSTILLADDLGMDVIHVFPVNKDANTVDSRLDSSHSYDVKIEPGSGPRHITFAPDGRHAYLMNELSGKVTVISYVDGILKPVQYVLSDSVGAHGSADIHISPDGRFLYASNRLKADGISIFKIDPVDGTIMKIGYQQTGIHPRNFALTPNGNYLLCACRDSNEIQIFRRNRKTGLLMDTGNKITMELPVCIKFF